MQLEVKTILNRIQHFAGFVYREDRFGYSARGRLRIHERLESHRSSRGSCRGERRRGPFEPVGNASIARWSGLFNGAWRIGSWKTFALSAWTRFTGARASGRTIS